MKKDKNKEKTDKIDAGNVVEKIFDDVMNDYSNCPDEFSDTETESDNLKSINPMINLEVSFSLDPTGASKDITEQISIPKGTCLFCCCDRRYNKNSLLDEVKKALKNKGYEFDYNFALLKVYVV